MTEEAKMRRQALSHRGDEDSHSGQKVIQDRFSMPQDDYGLIVEIREGMLVQGLVATKIGWASRAGQDDSGRTVRCGQCLAAIKTGRPSYREEEDQD